MKRLLQSAAAPQAGIVPQAVACAILAALAGVGLLAISGWFLVGAALAGLGGAAAVTGFNYLLPSAAIRAMAITRTAARYGERYLGHKAALFTLARLRPELFLKIASGPLPALMARRGGELAAGLGEDVDLIEDHVIRKASRPGGWAAAIAGLAGAAVLGWAASATMLAGLVAMRLVARGMAQAMLPRPLATAARALAAMKADYADHAAPCADIAVYGLAGKVAEMLRGPAEAHAQARMALVKAESRIASVQVLLGAAVVAGLVMVSRASAPLTALGVLGAMAALEIWAGLAASDMQAPRVRQALERLERLAETESGAEAELAAPPRIPAGDGAVPEAPQLRLGTAPGAVTVPPGGRLRIAGASGAGKTRLLETLVGLRRDAPEALAIDGVDPRDMVLPRLRRMFAYAAQDAPLIAGSVADNLGLARPGIGKEAMWEALRVACAEDVVRALPGGLDEWLGSDGARLSGGQRRRIALARALLARAPWLVLDEPSEGLDAETENRLVALLDAWLRASGTGLVLVSHRPAMAKLAEDGFTAGSEAKVEVNDERPCPEGNPCLDEIRANPE